MFPSLIMILTAAAGGAAGTVLRYEAVWLGSMLFGTSFPAGTVFVNCSGSLLIGILSSFFMFPRRQSPYVCCIFHYGNTGRVHNIFIICQRMFFNIFWQAAGRKA